MTEKKRVTSAAVVCHKGCVRKNNEDNFSFNGDRMKLDEMNEGAMISRSFADECQLYAVVDGMGGGDLGERASAIAASMLVDVLEELQAQQPEACLHQAMGQMSRAVAEDCRANNAEYEGTTCTALVIKGQTGYTCNVGDSRIYRLRSGSLEQLTQDHSLVWEAFQNGEMTREQARKSPMNNMITRYLGMDPDEAPEQFDSISQFGVSEGDRYMLCSDGVSDMLSNQRIEMVMGQPISALECATTLVALALEEGGKDNSTCIVVDVKAAKEHRPTRKKNENETTLTTTTAIL